MNNAEKQTLAERISAMTDEEKLFILRFVPSRYLSHELSRRCDTASAMLNKVDSILSGLTDESTLEDMQDAIVTMRDVLS